MPAATRDLDDAVLDRRDAANEHPILAVKMSCPRCGTSVDVLTCGECSFEMTLQDGIVRALPPERVSKYNSFLEDYARIRAAEGRGSESKDFYLSLPHKDTTGRNSGQWEIRARSYDYLVRHVLGDGDRGLGAVLDLGSGNCWLSYRLALRHYNPVAVDLLASGQDGLEAAFHYEVELGRSIPRFQAEATRLPFQSAQFDVIIFNASFHYAEDYEDTLRESLRCLKSGGIIVIMDTPWYRRDESGKQMVSERQGLYRKRFGTASDSIHSLEYLTDTRLKSLEEALAIRWTVHRPWYGWSWAMRPLRAKLQGKREPSSFRIYVGTKDA